MDAGTKRLFKGAVYGFIGALVFIGLVLLMYLAFTLLGPLIAELTERLIQSDTADRIREIIRTAR